MPNAVEENLVETICTNESIATDYNRIVWEPQTSKYETLKITNICNVVGTLTLDFRRV